MFQAKTHRHLVIPLAIAIQILSGCNDEDARVAQVAQEASERQAAQNQEMIRLNREVAEGTRRLVQSRGDADQELLAQEQNLQSQRDELDHERRGIAGERLRDSLLSSTLLTAGSLFVCSLPLVLCWFLLSRLANESAETEVNELLVERLIAEGDSDPPAGEAKIELPRRGENVAKLTTPGNC